ncbi:TIGR03088 family PEP-CTERM/XrtA system glycosyltransferase [Methylocaldum sp.]|uniref:TIGR03088 family PEP-CTERM/XrtA system glycosyltransferase n=1 Tax=Methylocaldum sp. TaxID=1969727 RepID=UPI002D3D4F42|nr:TIGR03088 family PEP-CTERM/XrtA system glycosyltransferase [Methylocaldum sp.]HYE37942.1 TIGR03088 family PEP-CTERM/XrtA system glycosyltransferase [Methylocaldum sp.]
MTSPLVAHIIYRLGVGGLENGLVNLINRTPPDRYRHAVICLRDSTDFRSRLKKEVPVYELHRREGQDFAVHARLYKLLRQLKPAIVHTRNLAALECQMAAWLAGIPRRAHGEHGWDVFDPEGSNRKYQWLRRFFRLLVHRYIPLSRHLELYLRKKIDVPEDRITRICNGVDTAVFHPAPDGKRRIEGCPFLDREEKIIIGTVGRMHGVKDQITLANAFLHLIDRRPDFRERVRLVLVGDGPLRAEVRHLLEEAGMGHLVWMPGERSDIADILRGLDIFVLPSQAEGISNTILEAMATGLPLVATDVGGNPELVVDGVTGILVPKENPEAMATALATYLDDREMVLAHGRAGLKRAKESFSLDGMVDRYLDVYDELLSTRH